MRVEAPMTMDQEQLAFDHLFNSQPLYIAPGEQMRLIRWTQKNHPGHTIANSVMDLENKRWLLDLERVTVTT
jgi:hypothetical protein